MPWKRDEEFLLADNFKLAERRLMNNLQRLKRNPELLQAYQSIMDEQLKLGIIEVVNPSDETLVGRTYYMPHHAVIREDKEMIKTRIVYDASSKVFGSSFNESLHAGNTTFTDLLGTLLRFRCYKTGLIGDIEKAFLSIGVKEEDRDALRFLWFDDPFKDVPRIVHM